MSFNVPRISRLCTKILNSSGNVEISQRLAVEKDAVNPDLRAPETIMNFSAGCEILQIQLTPPVDAQPAKQILD